MPDINGIIHARRGQPDCVRAPRNVGNIGLMGPERLPHPPVLGGAEAAAAVLEGVDEDDGVVAAGGEEVGGGGPADGVDGRGVGRHGGEEGARGRGGDVRQRLRGVPRRARVALQRRHVPDLDGGVLPGGGEAAPGRLQVKAEDRGRVLRSSVEQPWREKEMHGGVGVGRRRVGGGLGDSGGGVRGGACGVFLLIGVCAFVRLLEVLGCPCFLKVGHPSNAQIGTMHRS